MMLSRIIDFPDHSLVETPFPHFICSSVLSKDASLHILSWLETAAPWKLIEQDFYEQYEFSLLAPDIWLPSEVELLRSPEFLSLLKKKIGDIFSEQLSDNVDITAHKLIDGQSIRIHNDLLEGGPDYRFILQLNSKWTQECGGLLVLFGSENPEDVVKLIKPLHNTGIAFKISTSSHHAVSKIHSGHRYTIVYSFQVESP